jgi:hypothetical protein
MGNRDDPPILMEVPEAVKQPLPPAMMLVSPSLFWFRKDA